MRAQRAREAHKAAREAASIVGSEAAGAIEKVVAYAVSIDQRVKVQEGSMDHLHIWARSVAAFHDRPFLGRLRWLFTGR